MGRFVAFGEIMLRMSPPGRELLLQTPRCETWVAGAEANVATALALLGHDIAMVSAVPTTRLAMQRCGRCAVTVSIRGESSGGLGACRCTS